MASQRRFFQQLIANLHKRPRTKLALQLSASAAVASMPIMYWSHSARKERAEREHEVATRIRCCHFIVCPISIVNKMQTTTGYAIASLLYKQ
eukprot:scaffold5693_cov141-Skeletonema_menzelii.AAC.19